MTYSTKVFADHMIKLIQSRQGMPSLSNAELHSMISEIRAPLTLSHPEFKNDEVNISDVMALMQRRFAEVFVKAIAVDPDLRRTVSNFTNTPLN